MEIKNRLCVDGWVITNVDGFQPLNGGFFRFQATDDTMAICLTEQKTEQKDDFWNKFLTSGTVVTSNLPCRFFDDSSKTV